jgi:hypothetical protein
MNDIDILPFDGDGVYTGPAVHLEPARVFAGFNDKPVLERADSGRVLGRLVGDGAVHIAIAVADDSPRGAYVLGMALDGSGYATWAYEGSADGSKIITWAGHYFNALHHSSYGAFLAACRDLAERQS